jgi:hypothetical protein
MSKKVKIVAGIICSIIVIDVRAVKIMHTKVSA